MKKRNKYLFKNTIIFAVGNFASKFISFFLVPLYTSVLSTSDYGVVDLISTICMVLVPLFSLNISEAIMRFGLDKENKVDDICKIANKIFILSSLVSIILIPILNFVESINDFSIIIYLYLISLMGSQIYLCVLKGKEKLKLYTFGNVLNTFLIALFNIVFLVVFKFGLYGYLVAYVISNFIVMVYAIISSKAYKYGVNNINIVLLKKMIKYSVVLIPTTFMWWIMNSSDRIMVTNMISSSANGIYAISYKLPTLISTIIGIFTQAWLFSAISEKDSDDKEKYTNQIYKYLFIVCIICCLGLFMIIKPFMKIYVSSDFYSAWKYSSFLAIGVVFQSLASFISTSYNVYKDNKGFLFSGLFGAILNIILNFILIPYFKVYGAAFATCISYIAVFLYRIFDTRKYLVIDIFNWKYILSYLLMIISAFSLYIDNLFGQVLLILEFLLLIILYKNEFLYLLDKILKMLKSRRFNNEK